MAGVKEFQSFQSLDALERAEKQKADLEVRHALNNHADNLTDLNAHHQALHQAVKTLQNQMDALLDGMHQNGQRLDALEKARG